MRNFHKVGIGVVFLGIGMGIAVKSYSTSPQGQSNKPLRAHAIILGAPGTPFAGILGEAVFKQESANKEKANTPVTEVQVDVQVTGLPPGKHGFHVHENGSCSPTFTAAGGHFDGASPSGSPTNPNGNTNPDANHPYHMGDLPNLVADADGEAELHYTTSRISLGPTQKPPLPQAPLSLFPPDHPNGAAVIIHAGEDTGQPGVAGNAGGGRIACGVVIQDF
jgi:Cu-Zn family superoxide dismutase